MPSLVYLDVCCLNRPLDDQRQPRIRLEAEAVRTVLADAAAGRIRWLTSTAVDLEVGRNPDAERRELIGELLTLATDRVVLAAADRSRARALEAAGLGAFDALHLRAAERGRADVLLTTDDRFIRRAARLDPGSPVRVLNPVTWLSEGLTR